MVSYTNLASEQMRLRRYRRHCVIRKIQGHYWDVAQSNLAIISCFDIGVKLSISMPRLSSDGLICAGTNLWFSCGAIDISSGRLVSIFYEGGFRSFFHKSLTMFGKVEKTRHVSQLAARVSRVWKLCTWISQFIEEWVYHGINST